MELSAWELHVRCLWMTLACAFALTSVRQLNSALAKPATTGTTPTNKYAGR